MFTVKDIAAILNLSKNKTYALINSEGFPCIRIGRDIRIPKDEFLKWRKSYIGKTFIIN